MKKKIAVFASGWSEEMLDAYMKGIRDGLENESADVYAFMCYPALADGAEYTNGELNIFRLPNLNDFDGALILGNSIDYPDALKDIEERCREANIPIIYTGHKIPDGYFVGADNYYGAKSLCEHLFHEHGVRDFFFVAGSADNMDSALRIKALRDVLYENGMELPEEKIFYTNWNPRTAGLFIDDWLVSKRTLPRAFVCANDELAILMCEHLRKFGIKVPDEVIVTGFDNLVFAQAYDPSISSVSQKFDKIGYESVRMLIDILEGKECEKERMVLCEFIPGESCGCWDCCKANEVRREVGRKRFIDNMNSAAFYRKLSTIDRCIMLSDHYDEIKTNFKKSNDKTFLNYEGGSYHVLLDPAFKEKMYDSSKKYRTRGYAEKMDVMFSLDNGVYYAGSDFEVRNIVPTIANKDSNHLFICLPLQDRGSCLGYVIFADDYEKFRNSIFMSKYMERLAAVLIKVQQTVNARILNEKLIEISETDALTHVKNRMAYQTRENILNKEIKKGSCSEFAILLCDINDLKAMNDAWGHERGDEYIKNSCKLVCDTFKKSAVYRLGGDEFAVILGGNDYQNATQLIHSMNEAMDGFMKQDIPVWEQVSVAAGIAYFDANKDTCVADVLKRADEKMYSRKREMKSTKH